MEDRGRPASEAFRPPPGFLSSREVLDVYRPEPWHDGDTAHTSKRPGVEQLVRSYQMVGHRHAEIDPLGLRNNSNVADSAELDLASYGLQGSEMDTVFALGPNLLPGLATETRKSMTLRDIVAACQSMYCSTYSIELQHITDPKKSEWLRERLEVPTPLKFTKADKLRLLHEIMLASIFERTLATKAPNDKRFGLDGAESLAPAVATILDRSADVHGVNSVVVGSCHRGRLTTMGTIFGKPYESIFAEFGSKTHSELVQGMTGDVKSHLGMDATRVTAGGRQVYTSLLANPSHLEAVDPIAA